MFAADNTQAATCSGTPYCVSAAASQSISPNVATTITATVTSVSPSLSNAIVDVEIYNEANQQVFQKFFEGQTLTNGQTKSFAVQWTPKEVGKYTIKMGVFTQYWSKNLFWTDTAGTVTVANQVIQVSQPAPTQPQTTTQTASVGGVEIWWPSNGSAVTGAQPFKAMLQGKQLHEYKMYWKVDGGQENLMPDNFTDYPHKEVLVDVSGWNWRGAGPYTLTFVARDNGGQIISQKNTQISIGFGTQTSVSAPEPTAPAPTPAPSPVVTPTAPTTQPVAPAPTTGTLPAGDVTFTINSQSQKAISPFIYGTNFEGDPSRWDGTSRNLTFSRFGGNRLSTYNWENNASNAGSDWHHQNDGYLGGGDKPGEAVRSRIEMTHLTGAAALVTVPMLGHVAEDKNGDGDVANGGDYLTRRFEQTRAKKGTIFSMNPTRGDGVVYQDEFVNYLEQSFPYAKQDANRKIFYSLDNEPDLWSHTHPRIAASPATYQGVIAKSIEYASAIKNVAPHGLVFGVANYGFAGFETLQNASDANGRNFINTYLASMKQAEQTHGKRLLDVLDIHWYPEAMGGGKRIIEDDASPDIAYARMQAPRSLWDSTYKENSWIANDYVKGPIALLPSMQGKIATHYPGTKLAVTEYYYGGGNHISGGIAQADVLGIYGRENVFAANLWHLGNTDHKFIYGGFAMYRNYDGKGSTFGDRSISAQTSNTHDTSVYASVDSTNPNRMIIIAINKTDKPLKTNFNISHASKMNRASVYAIDASTPSPTYRGDVSLSSTNALQHTLPAYSVSTLVITQ